MNNQPVVFKTLAADQSAIYRLAALDSQAAPRGQVLVAEVEGSIIAAAPLAGGSVIADPFLPTRHLVGSLKELRRHVIDTAQRGD